MAAPASHHHDQSPHGLLAALEPLVSDKEREYPDEPHSWYYTMRTSTLLQHFWLETGQDGQDRLKNACKTYAESFYYQDFHKRPSLVCLIGILTGDKTFIPEARNENKKKYYWHESTEPVSRDGPLENPVIEPRS